jgi:chemotaxis methyl-accepting protein methylase
MTAEPVHGLAVRAVRRDDLEELELRLLLEAIYHHYGYDFREYARGSIKRRIWRRVEEEMLPNISALQERILHDPTCMERLLLDLSINVTSMFRDPSFYMALRTKVVPLLKTYPFLRIWNAGCSTGEETYSLAILLQEEGLGERARIYATDINGVVLQRAKKACSRSTRCASTPSTTSRLAGRPRSPTTTRWSATGPASTAAWRITSCSRSTTWCPTARSTTST